MKLQYAISHQYLSQDSLKMEFLIMKSYMKLQWLQLEILTRLLMETTIQSKKLRNPTLDIGQLELVFKDLPMLLSYSGFLLKMIELTNSTLRCLRQFIMGQCNPQLTSLKKKDHMRHSKVLHSVKASSSLICGMKSLLLLDMIGKV
jgi:hypothetical protein